MSTLLRDLRLRYRVSITQDMHHHLDHGIDVYSSPKTPLIDILRAYMRRIPIALLPPNSRVLVPQTGSLSNIATEKLINHHRCLL